MRYAKWRAPDSPLGGDRDPFLRCLRALVESGTPVDMNLQDSEGHTPLHLAILAGNVDVTRYLLTHTNAIMPTAEDRLFPVPSHTVMPPIPESPSSPSSPSPSRTGTTSLSALDFLAVHASHSIQSTAYLGVATVLLQYGTPLPPSLPLPCTVGTRFLHSSRLLLPIDGEQSQPVPGGLQGASLCHVGDTVYLYGGIGRRNPQNGKGAKTREYLMYEEEWSPDRTSPLTDMLLDELWSIHEGKSVV